jgi:hypothetical protein
MMSLIGFKKLMLVLPFSLHLAKPFIICELNCTERIQRAPAAVIGEGTPALSLPGESKGQAQTVFSVCMLTKPNSVRCWTHGFALTSFLFPHAGTLSPIK